MLKDDITLRLTGRDSVVPFIDGILGGGKGNVRRCPNSAGHSRGDKTPSLSFNPDHGGWKCHGCGKTGSLIDLWMLSMRSTDFPSALRSIAKQLGIKDDTRPSRLIASKYLQTDHKDYKSWSEFNGTLPPVSVREFIVDRYGLTVDTMKKYRLVWDIKTKRLMIPIPEWTWDRLMNIKRHDIMRLHCNWFTRDGEPVVTRPSDRELATQSSMLIPKWKSRPKTYSVADHGTNWLYPATAISSFGPDEWVYFVGGELKALLMLQSGYNAISGTLGEGSLEDAHLGVFNGRKIRVLMDPDDAGRSASEQIGQQLSKAGIVCEMGWWNEGWQEILPHKGDITDLIMRFGPDSITAGEYIRWSHVAAADPAALTDEELGLKDWSKAYPIKFSELVSPAMVGNPVKVESVISGMQAAPHALPSLLQVACPAGKKFQDAHCKKCRLPSCNFEATNNFTLPEKLELIGTPELKRRSAIYAKLGIPVHCNRPLIKVLHDSLQPVVLAPSMSNSAEGEDDERFDYRHRAGFILSDTKPDITENNAYRLGGTIMPDPKNGQFTFLIEDIQAAEQDALSWRFSPMKLNWLRHIRHMDLDDALKLIVDDFRDYGCPIYGQDDMIMSFILPYFMPLKFKIAGQDCERVCPQVCILGDSNVGKSTVIKNMMKYFGSGRFYDMSTNPTFAGMVGGMTSLGSNNQMFSWGVLPSSHRGCIGLDEFNKMPTNDIAKYTGLLSSGIASRVSAGVNQSTLCHVRIIAMANIRDNVECKMLANVNIRRELGKLYGTPQDLGRVEFVHIQPATDNIRSFNRLHTPVNGECWYSKEVARFHLSWAWNIKHVAFEDVPHLLRLCDEMTKEMGYNHPVLLAPQVRWKIGRVAAAFAALHGQFSGEDNLTLHVGTEHVIKAYTFLRAKALAMGD